jgi:hypothetical protein
MFAGFRMLYRNLLVEHLISNYLPGQHVYFNSIVVHRQNQTQA